MRSRAGQARPPWVQGRDREMSQRSTQENVNMTLTNYFPSALYYFLPLIPLYFHMNNEREKYSITNDMHFLSGLDRNIYFDSITVWPWFIIDTPVTRFITQYYVFSTINQDSTVAGWGVGGGEEDPSLHPFLAFNSWLSFLPLFLQIKNRELARNEGRKRR